MAKKRRAYKRRIVGGQVMMPADLRRLHKYMLEIEGIDHISDGAGAQVAAEEAVELSMIYAPRANFSNTTLSRA